ncbi:MAG: holo-ACP synthase [Chthoniobacteraceae bacterium]
MNVIGIGIDLVEVARFRTSLERHGERFEQRVFCASEIEYCRSMRDPLPSLAARFAAKEAVSKALGTGIGVLCGWHDIEIRRKASGEPFVVLHGAASETAARLGIASILISLSHTDTSAVAQAIALSPPQRES